MPGLDQHSSNNILKMLFIGDSGAGKTGALTSLVKAGYTLKILDFDNGLDILSKLIMRECPDKICNVSYISCQDDFKSISGRTIVDGAPKAFARALNALDNWEGQGPIAKIAGPETVLVIDSLTFACAAAMRQALYMNGRGLNAPQIQDWGSAMSMIEDLLANLYSNGIKCNVIITSHITYIERDDGSNKGYPSALGNKLPPKVGRYFNSIFLAKTKGLGANSARIIRTASEGLIELKHPLPGGIPPELPLETGLATIFQAICGGFKPQAPKVESASATLPKP